VPISFGNNPLGSRGGEEFHTLTQQEMAMHNHQLNADATSASQNTPGVGLGKTSGAITPSGVFNVSMYQTGNPNNVLAPQSVTNTGGSQAHENRMPYLVLNFCIALQGIFPSQN
jgi:microcystin-dependent protein